MINPNIKIKWPEQIIPKQKATIENIMSWDPFPGAEFYCVTIYRIVREANNMEAHFPIIQKRISGDTVLPLKELRHNQEPRVQTEYSYSVAAYGKSNEFLSESTEPGGTFILTDGTVLQKDLPVGVRIKISDEINYN